MIDFFVALQIRNDPAVQGKLLRALLPFNQLRNFCSGIRSSYRNHPSHPVVLVEKGEKILSNQTSLAVSDDNGIINIFLFNIVMNYVSRCRNIKEIITQSRDDMDRVSLPREVITKFRDEFPLVTVPLKKNNWCFSRERIPQVVLRDNSSEMIFGEH